jgi:hypothetical protein
MLGYGDEGEVEPSSNEPLPKETDAEPSSNEPLKETESEPKAAGAP